MNIFVIIGIAVGLSIDALAVSISEGLTFRRGRKKNAFKLAFTFGLFQALMPIIGWFAGIGLKKHIMRVDHWIAFGLLLLVGIKMIYESRIEKSAEKKGTTIKLQTLLILAIATSVDALVIGITFSILDVSILIPILMIGIITFINSLAGYFIGEKIGHYLGSKIEIVGGMILIGIGTKILIDHLGSF